MAESKVPVYRYRVTNFPIDGSTPVERAVVRFDNVSIDEAVLAPGGLRCSLPIDSRKADPDILAEGEALIWVERNDDLVGPPYLLIAANPDTESARVDFTCYGLWHYFRRRRFETGITAGFANTEQLDIFRTVVTETQALASGDIGLVLDDLVTGINRERNWEEGKWVGEALEQLARVIDGFEFVVEARRSGAGDLEAFCRFGYPELGDDRSNISFAMPGRLSRVSWPSTIDGMATDWETTGDIDPATGLVRRTTAQAASLGNPYARLSGTEAHVSVSEADTLQQHADRLADERGTPIATPSIEVFASETANPTNINVGDTIRVVANRGYIQRDETRRIVSRSLVPFEGGTEKMVLGLRSYV